MNEYEKGTGTTLLLLVALQSGDDVPEQVGYTCRDLLETFTSEYLDMEGWYYRNDTSDNTLYFEEWLLNKRYEFAAFRLLDMHPQQLVDWMHERGKPAMLTGRKSAETAEH